MVDFAHVRSEAEYREQLEHARAEARRRYRDHLAAAFELHRCPQPETLADLALKALTDWRYIDSGERCRCGCHPRLPESDFHDYGFDCVCTRTPEIAAARGRSGARAWRRSGNRQRANRSKPTRKPPKPTCRPGWRARAMS